MTALRDIRADDKDLILGWRNMTDVAQYMYTDHVITHEEHDRWFQKMLNDQTQRYWIITLDGLDVGVANITRIDLHNRHTEWAFYIAEPVARGKGIGSIVEYEVLSYVFDSLNLHKLSCEVFSSNASVVKMHKKYGFQEEGVFRQHIFKHGQFHDIVRLGLLDTEWAEIKPEIEQHLRKRGLL
jgi:UDP-4-amino-4,6-dideoxy-N-acetyl-beta-L-altrosamine N-acetyltransferase